MSESTTIPLNVPRVCENVPVPVKINRVKIIGSSLYNFIMVSPEIYLYKIKVKYLNIFLKGTK